jgi:hypothetical protein
MCSDCLYAKATRKAMAWENKKEVNVRRMASETCASCIVSESSGISNTLEVPEY